MSNYFQQSWAIVGTGKAGDREQLAAALDVTSALFGPMRNALDRWAILGNLFKILNTLLMMLMTVSSEVKIFIMPLLYATNDFSLMYLCVWGSLAVANVVLHCLELSRIAEKIA